MATFSNAQATHDNLSDFHRKQFKYDVIQVNNYISSAVMTLKAASSAGGTITDQEILSFQFKVYKKIKAPAEWTTHILFLESTVASIPGYTPETLFNETQAKYTTLLNHWASNKTLEEQTLAMFAQQQQTKKSLYNSTKSKPNSGQSSKTMEKDKKSPPFANSPSKLRDTKQWNGKTYLIQFPPEMDENWVRYGLAKLGQISELPNWQRMLFCAYTTQLLHSTGEVCWNNKDSYSIWFEFVCRNFGQIASRRSWKRSCLGLEYTSKCSRLALLWEPN